MERIIFKSKIEPNEVRQIKTISATSSELFESLVNKHLKDEWMIYTPIVYTPAPSNDYYTTYKVILFKSACQEI